MDGRWTRAVVLGLALMTAAVWYTSAIAGSDNSSDTYAADYEGGSLPIGTFIVLQYFDYSRANAFVDTAGHGLPHSHANIMFEFTRAVYFAQLWGHPLVLEADVPIATLTDVNIPGTNNLVAGGFTDPVVHFTYFFIYDAKAERWLGFTNYFYLPLGRYDNHDVISVGTAHQFTDVPQIGYTEGLGKFSPVLKGFFFDLIANASIHTDGRNPIDFVNPASAPFPGVLTYDKLTQSTSYDVKAFLRYEPKPFLWFAVGIEKSWGGAQVATNGRFAVTGTPIVIPQAPLSIAKDDFLRGHFEFQFPLAQDFLLAGRIFHDFDALGGFKNDIGVEIRLAKLFYPRPSSK
jgi:hypothetical protein